MSLLGIDIGTSGCKAGAFSVEGKGLAMAYREYPTLHPATGWAAKKVIERLRTEIFQRYVCILLFVLAAFMKIFG